MKKSPDTVDHVTPAALKAEISTVHADVASMKDDLRAEIRMVKAQIVAVEARLHRLLMVQAVWIVGVTVAILWFLVN